ncbi:glycine cleavage T C-terminal barrel domain-containing protein, partial [Rhizobium ruizarguesonis]
PTAPQPMTLLGPVPSPYLSAHFGRSLAFALVACGVARMGETIYVPMPDPTIAVEATDLVFFDKGLGRIHG